MVCEKCQENLDKLATPDPFEKGAGAARAKNQNKLLASKKKVTPYSKTLPTKCTSCKKQLLQKGKYCSGCAYKKGVCSICGEAVLDTKEYKMSK